MATFDVLLPVKDGIAFLPAALDSIVAQTFRDWRLIVLDHGSTDGSAELAASYAARDPRIELHPFPEARGLSGLLNAGLDLCDCKYVLRQDADDVSLPNRMEELARAFEADPRLAVIGSARRRDRCRMARSSARSTCRPARTASPSAALFRTPVCHPAAALRLDALRQIGERSGRAVRYGDDFIGAVPTARQLQVPGLAEDYFLFGQLALVAPCMNLDRKLIAYRWHGGNVGATKHQAQMQMALDISRSLAETAALLHHVPRVDPAPFCNHGERLSRHRWRVRFLGRLPAAGGADAQAGAHWCRPGTRTGIPPCAGTARPRHHGRALCRIRPQTRRAPGREAHRAFLAAARPSKTSHFASGAVRENSMNTIPLVSVVIPTYNRGHCIAACIDSVLAQTLGDVEIIVVDDCSSDDTAERVAAFTDARELLLPSRPTRAARRRAMLLASGARGESSPSSTATTCGCPKNWPSRSPKHAGRLPLTAACPTPGCSASTTTASTPCASTPTSTATASSACWCRTSSARSRTWWCGALLVEEGGLDENFRSCQDWDLLIRLCRPCACIASAST
ncbi:glycosyltransferase family 2 protein [Massilia sp. B-10]|nr:glycosyltransferase family 2 protein [Massilia sp. B-10]